eukprot:TRINITY_DN7757_c0_g1_i1.p1 TRINITY_DN7757_c0_g1~~TRINITY_DN7757_c0_g1_i1.p1  ORF type:complete len:1710 (+),score=873.35 TRINITY_DN7757_c0_g1_i1:54-5132(+)
MLAAGDADDPLTQLTVRLRAVTAERDALLKAVDEATIRVQAARRESNDYEQRMLRAEAEAGALHESLREAQELLEASLSGTPWEQEGKQRLEGILRSTRQDAVEVTSLYKRLKQVQQDEADREAETRRIRRELESARQDVTFLLRAARDPAAEPARVPDVGEGAPSEAVRVAETHIASLRSALAAARAELAQKQSELELATAGTHPAQLSPAQYQPQQRRSATPSLPAASPSRRPVDTNDPAALRRMLEDALADLAAARERLADDEMARHELDDSVPPEKLEGPEADRELLGAMWDAALGPGNADRLPRYRARLRQALADLAETRDDLRRARDDRDRAARELARARAGSREPSAGRDVVPLQHHQLQQALRDVAEARAEAARLKDEKARLLAAVRAASAQRRLQQQQQEEEELRRRGGDRPRRVRARSEAASSQRSRSATPDIGYEITTDSDVSSDVRVRAAEARKLRERLGQVQAELQSVKEERDKLLDQLVTAKAAAQAADMMKGDVQEERERLLDRATEADRRVAELHAQLAEARAGPVRIDRSCSAMALTEMEVSAAVTDSCDDGSSAAVQGKVDEFAFEQLKHVLSQTQQLLDRADQQVLEEQDHSRGLTEQTEELRTALERAYRDAADAQADRESLVLERDQWAQAARDADDARRQMVEHVERLQVRGGSPRRVREAASPEQPPDVADLLREKAELLVHMDILKERLGDSVEELEGARRELIVGLDCRTELQQEKERCAELETALRAAESSCQELIQGREEMTQQQARLRQELENAQLMKRCSGERLESLMRDADGVKDDNGRLRRENEMQMREIAFLCDTLTATSAQFENSTQRLEQAEAERNKLLSEKHRDIQRIEELGGRLTQVRLQNDADAVSERQQLQQERDFDALMLADRMKELEDAREEVTVVKSRATKAINVLKSSLHNALARMKMMGTEFDTERVELQERLFALDKQSREKATQLTALQAELTALQRRDNTESRGEKLKQLSRGLEKMKDKYAEQTESYEACKMELKAAKRALSENARYKDLFEEASETAERLSAKNRELAKEAKDMRGRLDTAGQKDSVKVKRQDDEVVQSLREQVASLQKDLKKEKELRLRLVDENSRARRKSVEVDDAARIALEEERRLRQEAEARLDESRSAHAAETERLTRERSENSGVEHLRHRCTMLESQLDEKELEQEALGRSLEAKDKAIGELREGLSVCRNEMNALAGTLSNVEAVAKTHLPSAVDAARSGAAAQRSRLEVADAAISAVRAALDHLQRLSRMNALVGQEDVGRLQAEFEQVRIELVERVRVAEEEQAHALDDLAKVSGEARRMRDELAELRRENIRLRDQLDDSSGLSRHNAGLHRRVDALTEERDKLLQQLRDRADDSSGKYAALAEARDAAAEALRQARSDAAAAKAESERADARRAAAEAALEALRRSVQELREEVDGSRAAISSAQRQRDAAAAARDDANARAHAAEEALSDLRSELIAARAEAERLRASVTDSESLSEAAAQDRAEVGSLRELLAAARRDADAKEAALQQLTRERDRLAARADQLEREQGSSDGAAAAAREMADRMHAEVVELNDLNARLTADLAAVRAQAAASADELGAMRRELAEATRQVHALRERLLQAETALATREAQLSECEAEVLRVKADLAETRRELDEGRDLMLSLVGPPEGVEGRGASASPRR